MWFVYVIYSERSGHFYKGMSSDVEKRLEEHNKGYNKSTKAYIPWELFFYEEYNTREEARIREKYLKSGAGREYIKKKWSSSFPISFTFGTGSFATRNESKEAVDKILVE